jgi:amino acid adenylation domain-containing protein/thioester reductase-like protein
VRTLVDRVLEHARARPEAPAVVVDGEVASSYGELAARSEAIAGGIESARVGIELGRSAEWIAAALGVWRAGAAFVPIDPGLPEGRKKWMVGVAGVGQILGTNRKQKTENGKQRTGGSRDRDLAYVIFTSGSTGRPKGVEVEHRGVMNVLEQQAAAFEVGPRSRVLWMLSPSFDASLSDIGVALVAGAALAIETEIPAGGGLLDRIGERGITCVDLPPSLLPYLDPARRPECLETVVIGGEVADAAAVRRWAAAVRLIGAYGPTEATICSSLVRCTADWSRPLIGRPLEGVRYRIVGGQLAIGGVGVARGYAGMPELTAERFVDIDGERWFLTGDRVRRAGDGYEYLGRVDRQLKIAGRLIAPEEVEAALRDAGAGEVAVIARRVGARTALCAYYTGDVRFAALRDAVARRLPDWMLPSFGERLEALPRTATGKVDAAALDRRTVESSSLADCRKTQPAASNALHRLRPPSLIGYVRPLSMTALFGTRSEAAPRVRRHPPDFSDSLLEARALPASHRRAAMTERQAAVADLFTEILGVEPASPADDFFDLGGDSLAAVALLAAAEVRGVELEPGDGPWSVAALAESATTAAAIPTSALARDSAWSPADRALFAAARAPSAPPRRVLITGATGHLGRHLTAALAADPDLEVIGLARSPDPGMLRGDVTAPRLGLDAATYRELCDGLDAVIHLAARVDVLRPYAALRAVNLEGTRAVVRLAAAGRPKALHLASTLSVFAAADHRGDCFESDHLLAADRAITGGYAQSKVAAELAVRAAALRATSVHRLGLLTAAAAGPCRFPGRDWLRLFVLGAAELGALPRMPEPIAVDITPVDHAAAAIAALLRRPPGTYHIANRRGASLDEIAAAIERAGIAVDRLDPEAWRARLADRSIAPETAAALLGARRAGGVIDARFDLFAASGLRFDDREARRQLAGTGVRCPPITAALLDRYVAAILGGRR